MPTAYAIPQVFIQLRNSGLVASRRVFRALLSVSEIAIRGHATTPHNAPVGVTVFAKCFPATGEEWVIHTVSKTDQHKPVSAAVRKQLEAAIQTGESAGIIWYVTFRSHRAPGAGHFETPEWPFARPPFDLRPGPGEFSIPGA